MFLKMASSSPSPYSGILPTRRPSLQQSQSYASDGSETVLEPTGGDDAGGGAIGFTLN